MKKRVTGMLAVMLAGICFGCAGNTEDAEPYRIYFTAPKTAQGSDIIQASLENLLLKEKASPTEKASAIVQRLIEGPEGGDLTSPFPTGVQLQSIVINDRLATVDFSSDFTRLEGIDLLLADYCLTLSLTELEDVTAVAVTAQGRALAQQPKPVFYQRDVLLSSMDDVIQTVEATLYFQDENGALAGEQRVLEIYEGQTQAENLLDALFAGPVSRHLTAVIPPELFINSVRMERGVCYVNFSAESLEFLPKEENRQRIILWSLSESLYSLDTVQEIHLLADGELLEFFGTLPVEGTLARAKG